MLWGPGPICRRLNTPKVVRKKRYTKKWFRIWCRDLQKSKVTHMQYAITSFNFVSDVHFLGQFRLIYGQEKSLKMRSSIHSKSSSIKILLWTIIYNNIIITFFRFAKINSVLSGTGLRKGEGQGSAVHSQLFTITTHPLPPPPSKIYFT